MISEEIKQAIQESLNADIQSVQRVSGGSINRAAKAELSNGKKCFLKWNSSANPEMFLKEKKGLQQLQHADTDLRVPTVLATGQTRGGTGFLVQEFINEGQPKATSNEQFGQSLAQLHQHQGARFGLTYDNYIGKLPQYNDQHDSWTDFFIEQRMQPQLRMAMDSGKLNETTANHFEAMYKQLGNIFPDEPPALLHGDLWGGNYFFDKNGKATIYDPAIYYGCREIELAFTYLFGGFSQDFYRAYKNIWPLEPNFSQRKDIYNLYPLLVHTNLFGGSYARQVESIVNRF